MRNSAVLFFAVVSASLLLGCDITIVAAENDSSGGAENNGSGGAENNGSGGAENNGSGGAENDGSGGAENDGSGGAENNGSGGAENNGSGGAENDGSGGAENNGSGGAENDGSGGHAPDSPATAACNMRLMPEIDVHGALHISEDGLTASSSSSGDTMRGSASHVGGRWYFEVAIDSTGWNSPIIGVQTADLWALGNGDSGLGAYIHRSGMMSSYDESFDTSGGEPYGAGDVVGVAVDLDVGRVFFSKNGAWMDGAEPAAGTGGKEVIVLPGAGSYYPAFYLSDGAGMTVNFGGAAFAYPPPAGYAPFAAGLEADASEDCVDPGPEGEPAPPAPMTATCDSEFTSYGASEIGGDELHIIGIYQSNGDNTAEVDVHVERQGNIVLALASHAPVRFRVTAASGATISRIILSSVELSSVSAPAGIPVQSYILVESGEWLGSGHQWPASTGGSDTQALVRSVESLTGLEMSSFGGCYYGRSFTLID
ncbi:SPRY domain-containing protein [Sorangium sp. So ce1153]|uniref:SPRY domain-containing protein n=1 Tax=Sorangium sp. So ce1153 TaxID=3133333 RepID=UPI003F624869